jgi:hypothetical protein
LTLPYPKVAYFYVEPTGLASRGEYAQIEFEYYFTDQHGDEIDAYVADPGSGVIKDHTDIPTVIEEVIEDAEGSSILEKYKLYIVIFATIFIFMAIICAIFVAKQIQENKLKARIVSQKEAQDAMNEIQMKELRLQMKNQRGRNTQLSNRDVRRNSNLWDSRGNKVTGETMDQILAELRKMN